MTDHPLAPPAADEDDALENGDEGPPDEGDGSSDDADGSYQPRPADGGDAAEQARAAQC